MMKKLDVKKDEQFCYSIFFERDFGSLSEEIEKLGKKGHKLCVVTDSTVAPLYLEDLKEKLRATFGEVYSFIMPAGEQNKTLDIVKQLYEYLILSHFDRKDCLIALGGGVVGDLTGFTAATYLRGIDFIQVPTTLLSQVDSSIGGKTGVDFESYKNMVGAFHMPRLVYMNLSVLNSLSQEQFSCGMGEILKHGLIRNRDYFIWCIEHAEQIEARDYEVLLEMIMESCRIKKNVVEKDPTEKGDRALLNFGHTIGHAVEKLKDFQLLHGQCVAIGSMAAMYLSWKRGYVTREDLDTVKEAMLKFHLPVVTDGITAEDILNISKSDKKMEAGKIKFVLLKSIGNAYVDKSVADEELLEASAWILEN
ncbi:MAG: 3-dehydroquinate synthase [Lachnospiraceae bacterium]